ncbi:MAG: phosphotransferase family protein [Pseudomonadota bacterium]
MSESSSAAKQPSSAALRPALERVLAPLVPGFERLTAIDRLSGGASQETYRLSVLANGEPLKLALRRSPGGEVLTEKIPGHPGLRVEAQLMRAAGEARVPEPTVYRVLEPDDALGDGFIMSWIEGEALGARIARGEAYRELRTHLAYDCGRVLARIHGIDLDCSGLGRVLDRISPAEFLEQTLARYRAYETPQPMIEYTARWLEENLPSAPRQTLVHNDFRNGNFMVSEAEIVAVLDWELAHIGDPMRDLGWICTNSWRFGVGDKPVGGFGDYDALFQGYEDESGLTVDREHVRFWEVFGSFWWSVGCLGMAEHYRTGPDATVERPAIGRRSSECQVDCVNLLIAGPTEYLRPENAQPQAPVIDLPRADELLESVKTFLHDDVMAATDGRTRFLARVAGNSLDVVRREWLTGAALADGERQRFAALGIATSAELAAARDQLIAQIVDRSRSLDDPALIDYLRFTVVNQAGIDQPRYSGYQRALRAANEG